MYQFELQAAAVNRQITSIENKNIINFLCLVQESNIYEKEELKSKFREAEQVILRNVNERENIPKDITVSNGDNKVATLSSNGSDNEWHSTRVKLQLDSLNC